MIRSGLIIMCILLFSGIGFSTVYYIDNTYGNDENDGISVSSPWKTISKVNAANFLPGDQILFKKGGAWSETLIISSNGSLAAPITFSSYGKGDLPVIDASLIRENSIYLHSVSNIIIENMDLRNNAAGGAVRIMYGNNIEARYNNIFVTGHGGFFIENSSNCLINANTITTPEGFYDQQTDGIYSQRNSGNTYKQNNIIITNSHPTQHIDGIQSFVDQNLTIRDNLIIQQNTKTNSQGIYTSSGSGSHVYFNNVIECPNTVAGVVAFNNLESGTASLSLYHNTLIGKGGNILTASGVPDMKSENNIFVALNSNYSVINIIDGLTNAVIDHNLYFNSGNPKLIGYQNTQLTFSQWKSLGFDQNSIEADPRLLDNYFLESDSPAMDKGNFLGEEFAFDKGGTPRPQFNMVDLGAYENIVTASDHQEGSEIPEAFELGQNYPNPFNPSTTISYSLPAESDVTLKVYDIIGKEVATLVNERKPAGVYQADFDASKLSSGIYIYQLKTDQFSSTKKMTLLK